MTLIELCEHRYKTDAKYRAVCDFFRQRTKDIVAIKKFAMEHRGWPEKEAGRLANDILCPTIRHFS